MNELFVRPLGPDGEPTGPMRRLGTNVEIRVDPGARDQWEQVEKILTRPNPYLPGLRPARFTSEWSFTIRHDDRARVLSLFHGRPEWMWTAWLAWIDHPHPPISRGTAWRLGTDAACTHQLTGPPQPSTQSCKLVPQWPRYTPFWPRWYRDLMIYELGRLYAENPDLFDPCAWRTDLPDLAHDYPAEQEPCPRCVEFQAELYDPWHYAYPPAPIRISHDDLDRDRYDFMPHYPTGRHR